MGPGVGPEAGRPKFRKLDWTTDSELPPPRPGLSAGEVPFSPSLCIARTTAHSVAPKKSGDCLFYTPILKYARRGKRGRWLFCMLHEAEAQAKIVLISI